MGLSDMIEGVARATRGLTGREEVVRLGVTGLSGAGKTVFITALVANLLDRARMTGLRAEAEGRIRAVYLQPQPDDTVPRFDYEAHLAALSAPAPRWPESTRAVSELRLSFRLAADGLVAGLIGGGAGERVLHLDIVDYPGEWLLDLGLLDLSYADWSRQTLERLARREEGAAYRALAAATDPGRRLEEAEASALAAAFTDYLGRARAAGFSDLTPGRFLLPGDLAGSPALTFAPLPEGAEAPGRGSLGREFARRYDAYREKVVKPFFRDHFARIDRQIVLADVLGALGSGPRAVADMRDTMAAILEAFRPGRTSWLGMLLGQRRIARILFAATKADHLPHPDHKKLAAIVATMMRAARDRADFAGAETAAMALASVRATAEEALEHGGHAVPAVKGLLAGEKGAAPRWAAFHPGDLPEHPAEVLDPARAGDAAWLDQGYGRLRVLPPPGLARPGQGLPHIRLDRALDFLIGDRL